MTRFNPARHARGHPSAGWEPLESRVLLSATVPAPLLHRHFPVASQRGYLGAVEGKAHSLVVGAASLAAGVSSSALPRTVEAGDKKTYAVQLTITNSGNGASAAAIATVTILMHPGSGGDMVLVDRSVKVPAIKGNKSWKMPAIKVAVSGAVRPDSYTVVAGIALPGLPVLTAAGPGVVVTGAAPGVKGLLASKTITFTATGTLGLAGSETGTFVTGDHLTGAYAFAPSTLVLEYGNGQEQTLAIRALKGQAGFDTPGDAGGTSYSLDSKASKAVFGATVEGDKGKFYLHAMG